MVKIVNFILCIFCHNKKMRKSAEKSAEKFSKLKNIYITSLHHIEIPHRKQNFFFNFRRKYRYTEFIPWGRENLLKPDTETNC